MTKVEIIKDGQRVYLVSERGGVEEFDTHGGFGLPTGFEAQLVALLDLEDRDCG